MSNVSRVIVVERNSYFGVRVILNSLLVILLFSSLFSIGWVSRQEYDIYYKHTYLVLKNKSINNCTGEIFPRYGFMNDYYEGLLSTNHNNSYMLEYFNTTSERAFSKINPLLPARDSQEMCDLVRNEIGVIKDMRNDLKNVSPYYSINTHDIIQLYEDNSFDTLTTAFPDIITKNYLDDNMTKYEEWIFCNYMIFYLKKKINRARPYQTSLLVPVTNFSYSPSMTSHTPSFPSGHAIQAYCASGIFYKYLNYTSKELLEVITDIADRRIIGGLHYPSDNYASAIVYHEIAPILFPEALDAGIIFPRNDSERRNICSGKSYPHLCRRNTSFSL